MARLNAVELAMMQSPLRALTQRLYELPVLRRMLARAGVALEGARLLDVGCGAGYETALLWRIFRPALLLGLDLMPEQLARARRAVQGSGARLACADVCRLPLRDGSFDAAFELGILHHVPQWRQALGEIARVVRPGGVLCAEELHGRWVALQDRLAGTSHPPAARFDWPAFRAGLEAAGFELLAEQGLAWQAARAFVARRRA
ncbi:MAG: hypothetical protein KatS3mg102_2344 [Planctomycetota bacterium]|nr:MAG: hypothetical protein KatS3mg102_2344 [Planctomycetota bacterium]